MTYTGDTAKYHSGYGEVYVNTYHDGDQTKKSYHPLNYLSPLGINFLGSEAGFIISDHAVRSFGKGQRGGCFLFLYW